MNAVLITAADALKMAVNNGAKALGFGDELGEIKTGMKADLIIIDTDKVNYIPDNNMISALAYSSNSQDVDTVIVDGKVLMKGRELKTIDEEKVKFVVREKSKALLDYYKEYCEVHKLFANLYYLDIREPFNLFTMYLMEYEIKILKEKALEGVSKEIKDKVIESNFEYSAKQELADALKNVCRDLDPNADDNKIQDMAEMLIDLRFERYLKQIKKVKNQYKLLNKVSTIKIDSAFNNIYYFLGNHKKEVYKTRLQYPLHNIISEINKMALIIENNINSGEFSTIEELFNLQNLIFRTQNNGNESSVFNDYYDSISDNLLKFRSEIYGDKPFIEKHSPILTYNSSLYELNVADAILLKVKFKD